MVSRLPQILLFIVVVILSSTLGYFYVRNYRIETVLDTGSTRADLQAVARMSRQNSEVDALLGRAYQYDASAFDVNTAIRWYLLSLRQNPYGGYVWVDLSRAYEFLGESLKAQNALQNATWALPASTYVHWCFSNFLVRNRSREGERGAPAPPGATLGERALFLAELRRTLELDPSALNSVLDLAGRFGISGTTRYEKIVPLDVPLQFAALSYFVQAGDWPTAAVAWKKITQADLPFSIDQTLPYINALIGNQRIEEAVYAWSTSLRKTHYCAAAGSRPALNDPDYSAFLPLTSGFGSKAASSANRIFNGEFLRDPLLGGFDWRMSDSEAAPIRYASRVRFNSHPCLRVNFTGLANINFVNIEQYVPVHPSTTYYFSAYVKSDGITTDQGPFFEILTMAPPASVSPSGASTAPTPQRISAPQSFQTNRVLGTNDWMELRAQVETGPETDLVLVRLRRLPSGKFDNLIKGRLWIGRVSLVSGPDARAGVPPKNAATARPGGKTASYSSAQYESSHHSS